MDTFLTWWNGQIGVSPDLQRNLFATLVVIFLLWLTRWLILRIKFRKRSNVQKRYQWTKSSGYISFGIGVILISSIWIKAFASLGTFLGLLSAGLAIALKDPLADMAGRLYILVKRPFTLEDRIEIASRAGDVVDISLFQFTIMEIGNWVDADQSTGRIIHLPNRFVFHYDLANYTLGFKYIWDEVHVLLTFESNWQKAKELFTEIASATTEPVSADAQQSTQEAADRYLIYFKYLTPIVYLNVKDNGIQLSIRFLTLPRTRRTIRQTIWVAVLKTIAEHDDIHLAYKTYRIVHDEKRVQQAEP
jgi:small-conductance mechanosensitive channel